MRKRRRIATQLELDNSSVAWRKVGWSSNIEPRRVIGSTDKTLLVVDHYGGSDNVVTMVPKSSYYLTFDDAIVAEILSLSESINKAQISIDKMRGKKERQRKLEQPPIPWE